MSEQRREYNRERKHERSRQASWNAYLNRRSLAMGVIDRETFEQNLRDLQPSIEMQRAYNYTAMLMSRTVSESIKKLHNIS